MIFLMSFSANAIELAINIVVNPKLKMIIKRVALDQKKEYFINKKSPAVTKVDLWTREDTGVGALIAIGNQLLKGAWALLVNEHKIRNKESSL